MHCFDTSFLILTISEGIVRSPCSVENLLSSLHPDIFTINHLSRKECEDLTRQICELHRMIDRVDIASFEVDLKYGSPYSCDDIVFRKPRFEVGLSKKRPYDGVPYFPSFHVISDLYRPIILTYIHPIDDNPTVFSDTCDALVWPSQSSSRRVSRFYGVTTLEVEGFAHDHIVGYRWSDNSSISQIYSQLWYDRIICVDRFVVSIRR